MSYKGVRGTARITLVDESPQRLATGKPLPSLGLRTNEEDGVTWVQELGTLGWHWHYKGPFGGQELGPHRSCSCCQICLPKQREGANYCGFFLPNSNLRQCFSLAKLIWSWWSREPGNHSSQQPDSTGREWVCEQAGKEPVQPSTRKSFINVFVDRLKRNSYHKSHTKTFLLGSLKEECTRLKW